MATQEWGRMMTAPRTTLRRLLAASVLSAQCASVVFSQQPTPAMQQAQLAKELANQKAANEVDTAIQKAEQLAKVASKAKALEVLKNAQSQLDVAVSVGSTKREELTQKLNGYISQYGGKPSETTPATDPKQAEVLKTIRASYERDLTEAKEVAEGLKKAADLKELNRGAEADRILILLANKYPNNLHVQTATQQTYTASQVRANAELSRKFSDAMLRNSRDVIASATPSTGDIQFMDKEKWNELTKFRKKQDKIPLTPKEEGILKSLDTLVEVNFQDRPFEEALQDLSNMMNQEIFIDKDSLKDAGLDLSRRMNFKGKVNARTALRGLLQSNLLTFVVKNEMIQVLTLERAEKELTTRSYYLGDLVSGTGPFGNAIQWGPIASYQQAVENSNMIVKMIKESIDPRSWRDSGGACTVSFHLPSMSVVVRASTEVHASLSGSLSAPPK
jgi:ribosomal protein S20